MGVGAYTEMGAYSGEYGTCTVQFTGKVTNSRV